MRCRVHRVAATSLWPVLLKLRRRLTDQRSNHDSIPSLQLASEGWALVDDGSAPDPSQPHILLPLTTEQEATASADNANATVFSYDRFTNGEEPFLGDGQQIDDTLHTILRLYLPNLIGSYRARQAGKLFVVAHLAQSLDGRIACHNGESRWISNEANLFHAHRLRALNDAVMVGARTVEFDNPELTVRHVTGDNPRRVILNASGSVIHNAKDYKVCSGEGGLFLCRTDPAELPPLNGTNEVHKLPPGEGSYIEPHEVAQALVERGIHSVFLEGGGRSVSLFLQTHHIDILHIHVAPRILGSGIPSFDLPEILQIDASMPLHVEHFSLDGELLFECRRAQRQERT